MKKRLFIACSLLAACLAAVVFVNPAFAIMRKMSVEELTNEASTITRGTVVGLNPHWNAEGTQIFTDVTIAVTEYIKGASERAQVTIQVPGGVVGEIGQAVEDVPSFEEGQEVILFLRDEYFRVVGWHQGKFTVENGMVLDVWLPVEEFIAGIRQTMEGSPPSWATETSLPEQGQSNTITSISPTSGPAKMDMLRSTGYGCKSDSTSVTFNGSGWPSSQGANDYALFFYQGSTWRIGCVDSWSSTQIVARTPGGASSGPVYVYLNGTWDGPGGPFTVTYSYGGGKWPAGAYPQPMSELYYINDNTADVTGEGAAVQAADANWDNVANADFYFRYGGTTTATDSGYNGSNEVMWRDLGTVNPLATCSTWWFTADPNTIIEFDIRFNDFNTWSIGATAGAYDIQSIATHELGHALQLLDLYGSADSAKTMYGYGSTNDTSARTLEPEDEAGISYIYPVPVCSAEVALEGESRESDLDLLRRFRDEVLATSPIGRSYIDLYYKHSPEMVKMLLLDSNLRSRTEKVLLELMPGIRELLDEAAGKEMVLTEDMVEGIEALMSDFAMKASPELRAVIKETEMQLKDFEGKSLKEIWLRKSTEGPAPMPMEKPASAVDWIAATPVMVLGLGLGGWWWKRRQ